MFYSLLSRQAYSADFTQITPQYRACSLFNWSHSLGRKHRGNYMPSCQHMALTVGHSCSQQLPLNVPGTHQSWVGTSNVELSDLLKVTLTRAWTELEPPTL